jgi:hypothetical protein
MKSIAAFFLVLSGFVLGQVPKGQDLILKGPQNVPVSGVVDGVVVKDEVPVRTNVEYEHVRLADYVWSKRLFSRIDAAEKVNHPLFFPYETFTRQFSQDPPKTPAEMMSHKGWIRNQERLSLWTIIQQELMAGNLSMYTVCDSLDYAYSKEDGYSLKYRINKYNNNDDRMSYFDSNPFYRREMIQGYENGQQRLGVFKPGQEWKGIFKGDDTYQYSTEFKKCPTFQSWCDTIANRDYDALSIGPAWVADILVQKSNPDFEKAWNSAMLKAKASGQDETLMSEDITYFLSSDLVTAYNIKEDWFFDKERSMLDKRIIAIAPVARHMISDLKVSRRGSLLVKDVNVKDKFIYVLDGKPVPFIDGTPTAEYELFWLYFPELRNVMVNYYVYNNQSDAQWMSFDDFFWKRMFSATIYRASDQFDREIEDYRYGVDALYEAEKIKETMRTWETDLWNY